jgi:hypothetical protein
MLRAAALRFSIGSGPNRVAEGTDAGSARFPAIAVFNRYCLHHCLLAFAGSGCISDAWRIGVSLTEEIRNGRHAAS